MNAPASTALRPVYSAKQFAEEVLQGNRCARWVQDQCRFGYNKKVKTAPGSPYMIPRSEAERFINPR